MKRLILSLFAGAMLLTATAAIADEPFNPDCHLQGINDGIDGVIAQIKSSPALGHAGGHYAKALKDLEATKKQLHEGCHAWNKSLKK
jgi:hypothetical protein